MITTIAKKRLEKSTAIETSSSASSVHCRRLSSWHAKLQILRSYVPASFAL